MSSLDVARQVSDVIGPNAILQSVEVVRQRWGDATAASALSGTGWTLDHLPRRMVEVADVLEMTANLRALVGQEQTAVVLDEAGERTARYLLSNRIPRAAQLVMRWAPDGLATRLLMTAISRNRWTFAGSADVRLVTHPQVLVEFRGCPLCRGLHASTPVCHFYAATFRGLFRELVNPRVTVTETACEAVGDPCCRFTIAS